MAPNPTIITVAWPSSPKEEGDLCQVLIDCRNDGTDGDIFNRIVDSIGNVLDTITMSFVAGEMKLIGLNFYMPNHDIIIYAQVGADTTVTDQRGPYPIEFTAEPAGWEPLTVYRGIDIWVWMPAGTPFAAYFGGAWHYADTLSAIKDAIDAFLGPEEPEGNFDVTGIVTPVKAGFLVEFWWGTTVDNMTWADDKTTGSDGKVHWRPWSSIWPMKVQLKIPAGQVVDNVEYGYAESGILTAWKDTIADLYLYPEAVGPPPGPYTVIDDFVVPDSLPAGSTVTVSVLVRNTGSGAGRLEAIVDGNPINPGSYITVAVKSTPADIQPGNSAWLNITFAAVFNMPTWDYNLTARNYDETSQISKTIMVSVGIPTTLTITAPDLVDTGEIFTVYGNLFETETDILIPGMRINISYNGKVLGYGYTGPEGDYYIDISINEGGVWTIKAEFPGTEALQASMSQADAVVAISTLKAAIAIIVPAATGLAMIMYGLS